MLQFTLLGPLEVRRDGEVCTPSAPMQRSLIGLLLLHVNELLPARRIIDILWRGRPPRSADSVLQMYVCAVRRVLATARSMSRDTVLHTVRPGYILKLTPDQLDVVRFRSLTIEGRTARKAGRCSDAAQLFRQALEMWRGPALADLADGSGVFEPYAARLDAERMAVIQERVGVDLCQGRSIEIIGELEELCARHPMSESLHQQLMLALQQSGRQSEALEVYAGIRHAMADHIGIEPGGALRATQHAILSGQGLPEFGHPEIPSRRGAPRACEPAIFGG